MKRVVDLQENYDRPLFPRSLAQLGCSGKYMGQWAIQSRTIGVSEDFDCICHGGAAKQSISYGKALADKPRMLSLIDGRDRKICYINRALALRVGHKIGGRDTVLARAMRLWRCAQGPSLNMRSAV